jgi:putative redox protein|tara:strand:+ start:556 stop:942 length:387 start_codon:yes stop_codon:yes gene_type:complete
MHNSNTVLTNKNYAAESKIRNHFVVTDVPVSDGGEDTAPTPVEYLLTAIGGCVAITLRMYAARRSWDVGEITVNVFQLKDEQGSYLREEISFENDITEDQRKRLLVFAGKCPVARMVKGETRIESLIK